MNYCILSDANTIINIIACENDDTAVQLRAVPSYDGATIGQPYDPPPPPAPEPTDVEKLQAQVADLQNQILTMRLGVGG